MFLYSCVESDVIIYTLSDSTTLTVYCESLHVFFFFSSILFYSKQVIIDLLVLSVKVATEIVVEGGGGGVIIMLGAGIAQWLERRTHDRKVAGSSTCMSGGRIFFSRVNFLC